MYTMSIATFLFEMRAVIQRSGLRVYLYVGFRKAFGGF